MNKKWKEVKTMANIRDNFPSIPINYPIPEVSTGLLETHKMVNEFKKERMRMYDHGFEIGRCYDTHHVLITLVHKETGEISAIVHAAVPGLDMYSFFPLTEWLPFHVREDVCSKDDIEQAACHAKEIFLEEMKKERLEAEYPLLIIRHVTANDYIGYSPVERKILYIANYKIYHNQFEICPRCGEASVMDQDKYTIYVPDSELINALGVDLYPEQWEQKREYDTWYSREPWINRSDIIPPRYREIYGGAVEIINSSHSFNLGHDRIFYRMEQSLKRLERMCEQKVATSIIGAEIEILLECMRNLSAV